MVRRELGTMASRRLGLETETETLSLWASVPTGLAGGQDTLRIFKVRLMLRCTCVWY